jgi:hypothetical protein
LYNYELTERGKIIIAIVLVLLLLVLPSTILAVRAWNTSPPPPVDDPSHTTDPEPGDDLPEISNGPLPDGSGLNPLDPPEQEPPQAGNEEHDYDPPEFGPIDLNLPDGTMLFLFSPEVQEVLDSETISMLSEFVTSPKNTADAQIIAEIPALPEEEASMLIAAINDAFALYGVSHEDLSYVVYQSNEDERSHEVKLSFVLAANRK